MNDHLVVVIMEYHVMAGSHIDAIKRVVNALEHPVQADCYPHKTDLWVEDK